MTAPGPEGPIQIRSLASGRQPVIPGKDFTDLSWAADGKGLIVSSNTNNGAVLHLDLGNSQVLWKCGRNGCSGAPSPDGRHLAIDDGKLSANMWMMENFWDFVCWLG